MRLSGKYLKDWVRARLNALRSGRGLITGYRIVTYSSGRVYLERFEKALPGPNEVLVKIAASTVSIGTERANYLRMPNTGISYPHSPGYSAAGEVICTGSPNGLPRPGTRVAVKAGHASLAVLPAESVHVIPSEAISLPAASIIHVGIISLQGVERANIEAKERVAVIGQGVIGLIAARLAKARGAKVDLWVRSAPSSAARRSADTVRVIDENRSVEQEGYSVIVDCTGDPGAILLASRLAHRRARVVLLGSNRGKTGPFSWGEAFVLKELTIIGAHFMSSDPEGPLGIRTLPAKFLDITASGALKVDDLLGKRINPREAWRFYRDLGRCRVADVGAWFDWTLADRRSACRKRSLFSGPLRWWNEESLADEFDPGRRAVAGRFA